MKRKNAQVHIYNLDKVLAIFSKAAWWKMYEIN